MRKTDIDLIILKYFELNEMPSATVLLNSWHKVDRTNLEEEGMLKGRRCFPGDEVSLCQSPEAEHDSLVQQRDSTKFGVVEAQ